MRTEILYEDEQIIVAYKPAGLAVQTAKVGQADMVSELKNHRKSAYLGVVHRLDQPVEGLLVFGKTKGAAAALNRQLTQGNLNKSYCAVICGKPSVENGELTDYLRKTPDGRAEVVDAGADAKKAVLRYQILQSCVLEEYQSPENSDTSVTIRLADICIDTGRFHQIRAQMAHAGMPLLGDVKYGDRLSRRISGDLQVRSVALCACQLEFKHPVTRRQMLFQTEPRGDIFQKFFYKSQK